MTASYNLSHIIFDIVNDESLTAVLGKLLENEKENEQKLHHTESKLVWPRNYAYYNINNFEKSYACNAVCRYLYIIIILFQVSQCDVFENRHVKRPYMWPLRYRQSPRCDYE